MNMLNTEAWLNSISRLSRIPIVLLLGLIFLGLTFTVFRQSPALAQPQTSSPARVEPITLGIGDPVTSAHLRPANTGLTEWEFEPGLDAWILRS